MAPLSIIIPTYRVGKDLLKLVNSLHKQIRDNDEIIVVDNHVNRFSKRLMKMKGVHYYKYPVNKGPCPARNYGLQVSKNEWLLFLDDDGIAPDGMLDGLRNIIQSNPDFYAIRGRIIPKNDYIYQHLQKHYDLGEKPMPYMLNLEGIVAIRKRELEAVGGWNNSLYGHEGEELSYRLIDRFGYENCQYHPDLVFCHDFSDSLVKFLKKNDRHRDGLVGIGNKYSHLKPLINKYKYKTPGIHHSTNTLSFILQKKLQLVLRLADISSRHPVFKHTLITFLQGLKFIGIRI